MNYICRTLFQPDSQFDADEYDRLKTRMAESQSHPQPQAEIHPDARSDARSGFNPPLYLACGPLLRFTGIEDGVWHGSILVVTEDRRSVYRPVPVVRVYTSSAGTGTGVGIDAGIVKLSRTGRAMRIKSEDEVARGIDHSITADPGHSLFGAEYDIPHPNTDRNTDTDTDADAEEYLTIPAHTLHAEQAHTFFRFDLALPLSPASSTKIVYRLNGSSTPQSFYIPSTAESMHVLFHSCNGFSLSVDSGAFSGPDPLWRDVLRAHTGHSHRHSPRQARPFHIMLGGGDQIYNDAARTHPTTTHFHAWTQSRPLARKRSAPFSPPMRAELHRVFLRRYLWWFSQGLFAVAAAHIPSVNVWDDHDLIDGYGSYPRRTMEAPVLRGLGGVAAWYYLLFQHHVVPVELVERERELAHAHAHAHVPAHEPNARENCYITGPNPGPYIPLHSRSVFMHLGPRLAFLGIDCRMERTRTRVLSPETWEVVFQRCRREIVRGRTRHLLVMIETLLSSGLMTPLKALFRAGLVPRPLAGLFNQFDGGIELLDDLDDHWTARHHRRERASFVLALQGLAWDLRVRVTLLAGDVHLAAVGGFYTTPGFGLDSGEGLGSGEGDDGRVRRENDPRYMLNIISSAIANRPPADRVADILNRCDRVHYLGGGGKDDDDKRTREEMLDVFHVDVDGSARRNVHLLPRRNWCEISEVGSSSSSSSSGSVNSDLHVWLHAEVEQGHPGGWTRGYQVVVPGLE